MHVCLNFLSERDVRDVGVLHYFGTLPKFFRKTIKACGYVLYVGDENHRSKQINI